MLEIYVYYLTVHEKIPRPKAKPRSGEMKTTLTKYFTMPVTEKSCALWWRSESRKSSNKTSAIKTHKQ
jgi:hypothetical protein